MKEWKWNSESEIVKLNKGKWKSEREKVNDQNRRVKVKEWKIGSEKSKSEKMKVKKWKSVSERLNVKDIGR